MCGEYNGPAKSHGTYPLNHVALSVPDVDAAADWYTSVLGFHELRPRTATDRSVMPDAPIFRIYPASLQKVRMAYLSAGNGVGVELFQFSDPGMAAGEEANFEKNYFRGGIFHIAVTTPDIDETVKKVVANKGRKIGDTVNVFGHHAAYIADPWGNVVEVITASFERIMANR
ncbi:hypothetical protein SPI_07065 [Niveomyces insectorum RCEF 264]|uniref:VOC domain-containing protein n=1 Tax=Niveomyces insectorum RCEF 264 TaxID=1081102 RepID=A0A167Q8N9_9HYPO|nr:hypothetical protein SPI_07065 [Niveomyces insectorum RCEF 264]